MREKFLSLPHAPFYPVIAACSDRVSSIEFIKIHSGKCITIRS